MMPRAAAAAALVLGCAKGEDKNVTIAVQARRAPPATAVVTEEAPLTPADVEMYLRVKRQELRIWKAAAAGAGGDLSSADVRAARELGEDVEGFLRVKGAVLEAQMWGSILAPDGPEGDARVARNRGFLWAVAAELGPLEHEIDRLKAKE
jgi:hypothetical protein